MKNIITVHLYSVSNALFYHLFFGVKRKDRKINESNVKSWIINSILSTSNQEF